VLSPGCQTIPKREVCKFWRKVYNTEVWVDTVKTPDAKERTLKMLTGIVGILVSSLCGAVTVGYATTSMPIERAVPRMVLAAASTVEAFMSGIF
jgi:hypothetical protein